MNALSPPVRAMAPVWLLPAVVAVAMLAPIMALFLGVADIAPVDVLAVLSGHGSQEAQSIIWDIRLPRIVTGALAGVHLATAGLLLQNITRNPLADPSIMGISQGATLSISIFLLLAVYIRYTGTTDLVELPVAWLPTIGTLKGLLAGAGIYALALRFDLGPLRITLCGIAVGAVMHAMALGLIVGWGSHRLEIVLDWLAGSLYARTWSHAAYLVPYTLFGLAVLPLMRRPLDLLGFDAPVARSFGLNYKRQLTLALVVSCILAASAVGTVGPVAFVGLVVPHIARHVAGRHFALVMPLTVALGAIAMTLADLVGRLVGQVDEIPVGIIAAIVGVPVFIFLIRKAS